MFVSVERMIGLIVSVTARIIILIAETKLDFQKFTTCMWASNAVASLDTTAPSV